MGIPILNILVWWFRDGWCCSCWICSCSWYRISFRRNWPTFLARCFDLHPNNNCAAAWPLYFYSEEVKSFLSKFFFVIVSTGSCASLFIPGSLVYLNNRLAFRVGHDCYYFFFVLLLLSRLLDFYCVKWQKKKGGHFEMFHPFFYTNAEKKNEKTNVGKRDQSSDELKWISFDFGAEKGLNKEEPHHFLWININKKSLFFFFVGFLSRFFFYNDFRSPFWNEAKFNNQKKT